MLKEKTELGNILISNHVIGQIVEDVIKEYKGKIFLTNSKGKRLPMLYKTIGGEELTNVHIDFENERPFIKVYVMLKLGVSIKDTLNSIMDNIEIKYAEATNSKPYAIHMVVTGILSKQVAKRNIEMKRYYE